MDIKNKKNITPLNNYCEHSHTMSKGVNVYNTNQYKDLYRSLESEFLPLENKALFEYEKWLTNKGALW